MQIRIKIKSRATHDTIAGAVIGPLRRPAALVLGRYRVGRLVIVGRTVPLSPAQAEILDQMLRAPEGSHPWPEQIRTNRFGPASDLVAMTRAALLVVV